MYCFEYFNGSPTMLLNIKLLLSNRSLHYILINYLAELISTELKLKIGNKSIQGSNENWSTTTQTTQSSRFEEVGDFCDITQKNY